jgi:hypothetical protein
MNLGKSGRDQVQHTIRYLPGGTQENHENISHYNWCPGRDLNVGPEGGGLTTRRDMTFGVMLSHFRVPRVITVVLTYIRMQDTRIASWGLLSCI